MYFYHEGYRDAHCTGAALEDVTARDRRDEDANYEPIRLPAILNWLMTVGVALCVIVATIQALS
jgi:hypothetical protein